MANLRELDKLHKRYWTRIRELQRELASNPANEVKQRELALAQALYKRVGAEIQDTAVGRPKSESPWCHCGNPSDKADFFDNGQHPKMATHHWRCHDCGGVLQIG